MPELELTPEQQKSTVQITFEGVWKWAGVLPERYMIRLCDYAEQLQDEANSKGEL